MHGTLVGLIFTIAWLKFTLKPLSIDIMAMIKLFYKKNRTSLKNCVCSGLTKDFGLLI